MAARYRFALGSGPSDRSAHRGMRVRCVDYLGRARRTARYWHVCDIEYRHGDNACLVLWVLRSIKPI